MELGTLTLRKFFVLDKPSASPAAETEAQFGGYAETIITAPADFDAFEIQGVRDMAGAQVITDGTCCEVDNENPEFFSVYAHLVEGGVECIGDFTLLGFTRSEVLELTVRAELHSRLLDYIEELKLTPSQLVSLLGIHQPDVNNLLNGRISKFSVTKLIKFAGKLNLVVEVRLTKPSTGTVFISKRTRKLEAKQLHAVVSLMSASQTLSLFEALDVPLPSQTARMSSLIEA